MKKIRTIIIVAVILAAIVGGFLYMRYRAQSTINTQLQTATIERGDLQATVGATGTVRARQSAILTWQTTGTVDAVNVSVGDTVMAGDLLASLSKSSLSQSIILAEADLVTAQRDLDTLLISKTPAAQAQATLASAQQGLEDAQMDYYNVMGKRATQETIDDAKAQYDIAMKNVDKAQKIFNMFDDLPKDNPHRAQAYHNLYAAWQARDRALANLNWYRGQPSDVDIAQAEAQLTLAKAKLEDAQREWDRLKDGPDAADILAAQARVTAIQATLKMERITAPFSGTVTVVQPLPGDQVSPGLAAFRIDDLSHLLVDVQVSEVDINGIQLGQPVTLTFDAILNKEYTGKVVEVAQVGENVSGSINFTVTVELDDADAQVKPGMTASVTIVTNEIKDALLVPNRAVRIVSGERVVYVLRNGLSVQVKITLGATSDLVSEVVGGDLREGDLIILNPPAEFMTGNGPPSFMGR